MSTLKVTTIKSLTASTPTSFQDTNGVEVGQLCRVWVNFNGTGTVAIRDSFNCNSITDNGTGDYTVNFTTALPSANYAVSGTGTMRTADAATQYISISLATAHTASLVRIKTFNASGAVEDFTTTCVLVHGD